MLLRFLAAAFVGTASLSLFADDPAPVVMTAQQDHKQMMEQLGIKEIRRGRDGNNKSSPNYANYDESKANPFPVLPDPLKTKDGKAVTSIEMWETIRDRKSVV